MAGQVHDDVHMANDSHLFRTAAQLEAEGFYPVQGNRWKRGESSTCPCTRADDAGVRPPGELSSVVNPENLKSLPQPKASFSAARRPNFSPGHQYWVPESIDRDMAAKWVHACVQDA